jgi:hypothetical protein
VADLDQRRLVSDHVSTVFGIISVRMAEIVSQPQTNSLAARLNGTENRPKMTGNLANVGSGVKSFTIASDTKRVSSSSC